MYEAQVRIPAQIRAQIRAQKIRAKIRAQIRAQLRAQVRVQVRLKYVSRASEDVRKLEVVYAYTNVLERTI